MAKKKDKITLSICYENPQNHLRGFMDTDMTIDEWKSTYPQLTVAHAYRTNWDMKSKESDARYYFNTKCLEYGLTADMLHDTFESDGQTFEIIGLNPSNTKYKVITRELSTGKTYKQTPKHVLRCLAEKETA